MSRDISAELEIFDTPVPETDEFSSTTTNVLDDGPKITSFQDLQGLCEVFENEDGQHVFSHCSFYTVSSDYVAYSGQSTKEKKSLTIQDIQEALKRIPDQELYPEASSVTYWKQEIDNEIYLKSSRISNQGTSQDQTS